MPKTLRDCVVFCGPELQPHRCSRFEFSGDTITAIDRAEPIESIDSGALVVIPGLYNSHTHMGDSFLPDGATGLTLEQGFFRPQGMKYRELEKIDPEIHLQHLCASLNYMARTGTLCHLDFREQGPHGSELLREASHQTGVESVILGQFEGVPFDKETLDANLAELPAAFMQELKDILSVADGFSESTMNDMTDAAWDAIFKVTSAQNKMRAIHCLENEGYREDSLRMSGTGDLERALKHLRPHIIVHMTVASRNEMIGLVESGTTAVLNPRANANLALPLPPVSTLLQLGANLLLGTDNGLLNSPNMFAELDFSYKLAKSQGRDPTHPQPVEVLRMATSNIRPVLGGDHYGSLEVGLPADFVVLDFHQTHLSKSRNLGASTLTRVTPEDVLGTYRQGKPLYSSEALDSAWDQCPTQSGGTYT